MPQVLNDKDGNPALCRSRAHLGVGEDELVEVGDDPDGVAEEKDEGDVNRDSRQDHLAAPQRRGLVCRGRFNRKVSAPVLD